MAWKRFSFRPGFRLALAMWMGLLAAGSGQNCRAFAHLMQEAQIPMGDGQSLAADVYLPAETGEWPVILIQTPYNKTIFRPVFTRELSRDPLLKSPDYAFVALDWRGYFGSEPAGASPRALGLDGYDAVEWIADRDWCDGAVGTWGASALGVAQFRTAEQAPPHLKACAPLVSHGRDGYDISYGGGVYHRNRNTFVEGHFGGALTRSHPYDDNYWRFIENNGFAPGSINAPMLHISGWYDHETDISVRDAFDLQANGGEGASGTQKILIGPWAHGKIGAAQQAELAYPDAEFVSSLRCLEFFDHYLRGIDNGYENRPVVEYYDINTGLWHGGDTWPPPDTQERRFRLTAGGALSDGTGDPAGTFLEYESDPEAPVPTLFGAIIQEETATQGPGDLSELTEREDVLTFRTATLDAPLRVLGRPRVRLWVECDAVDTDLMARLVRTAPTGEDWLIVDGARRASLRDSFETPAWLAPGEPVEVTVELPSVSVTIPAGHRLGLLVGPSNYDRFDVNLQDGSSLSDEDGATTVVAQVNIYTGEGMVSELILPVPADDTTPTPAPTGTPEPTPTGSPEPTPTPTGNPEPTPAPGAGGAAWIMY